MAIYSLTSSVPAAFGGLTKAVLQRVELLRELNMEAYILTLKHDLHIHQNIQLAIEKGLLHNEAYHINFFEKLAQNDMSIMKNGYAILDGNYAQNIGILERITQAGIGEQYYFNALGHVQWLALFDENDKLIQINEYSAFGTYVSKKYIMNEFENIAKIQYIPKKAGPCIKEEYYNSQGRCYLTYMYENEEQPKEVSSIIWHNGEHNHVFKTVDELYQFVIDLWLTEEDICFSDKRVYDDLLLNNTKIKRFFVCHLRHWVKKDKIRPAYQRLFSALEEKDGTILCFTKEQAEDIIAVYPYLHNRIIVIPHYIDQPYREAREQGEKHFVIISRFTKGKNIAEAIQAFHHIHAQIPNYTLEVYGSGEEEQALKELVANENMLEVHINGFTTEGTSIFYNAAASLCTSQEESFGLSISESLAQGCPVLAYHIPYGPKDLLEKKVAGALIQNHDRMSLEHEMVQLAKQNDAGCVQRQQVQRQHYDQFSKDAIQQQWQMLLGDK